jgi:hypothetical protein
MPKGIRDHQHTSKVSMEAKNLKIGGADPNNPSVEEKVAEEGIFDEDSLLPSEQRKIFVQVAALNAMNGYDTFEFMRHFICPDITERQVEGLVEKYRGEILKSRDVLSMFVDRKFPHFNPFKQAATINQGLKIADRTLYKYTVIADREPKASKQMRNKDPAAADLWEWNAQANFVGQAARGNSIVSQTYIRWREEMIKWGDMVDALIEGAVPQAVDEETKKSLDPRKVARVARSIGVDGFLADRLAQLLVYGEQRMYVDADQEDYFTKDGEEEGNGEGEGVGTKDGASNGE